MCLFYYIQLTIILIIAIKTVIVYLYFIITFAKEIEGNGVLPYPTAF